MTEKVRLEENTAVSTSDSAVTSDTSSASNAMESRGLLMTHSSSESRPAPSSNNIRGFSNGARTTEHSRTNANNVSLTFDENGFIEQTRVQPGISRSTLLNIEILQNQGRTQVPSSPSDSIVITVEDQPTTSGEHRHVLIRDLQQAMGTENFLNNIREAANQIAAENRNNNNVEDDPEAMHVRPQVRALLKVLGKYIPFILILLAKGIYDHRTGVLKFIVLLFTFHDANNVLKREVAKQHNRSWSSLLFITCYIVASIIFIDYNFETHLFSAYTQPLTIWELLWSVLVTDFVLKLITIVFKVILTCLPARLLALQKRGKYYLMVEATSQLYRCIAPVQPWLYYLFEAYQGPEKILGVFLSVSYIVSKGSDLLSHVKLFHSAVCKLLQNVNLGVSPSKEQLVASGGICTICHEEYSMPVRLHCKHIFCETCVSTWLDRERSCPLCRAAITDDPIYRDGHTTHFIQLY